MERVRVLLVEDERLLADSIAEGLRRQAMAVDVAYDGDAALEQLAVTDYDVVVLDRDLPIVSGDEVCATLVNSGVDTRILMLTAAAAVKQRVAGLGLGADDYLTKPFAFAELAARIQALGRRARPAAPPVLERAGIRLDPYRRTVTRDGQPVALSRKEFAVLAELLRAEGGVVSAEQLLEKAWDEHIDPFTGVVRFTIMMVRRKLGDPPIIETVPGAGYRIPMTNPRRRRRSTVRTRLTVLYAGAFFLAGAALVVVMYFVLRAALDRQVTARVGIAEHLPTAESSSQQSAHEEQEALRAQFRQDRDDTLNTMLIASLAALGGVGVIARGFGWLLAGRALHPLQHVTATARRVADRSLHERIALDGPDDEIKDLADTFDAMLERLDRSFDSQRRFVANASHELRTPLAINRTLIEVALDNPQASESLRQLGTTLLAVNQRHERLIDGLLTLASSEERLTEHRPVDLADIVGHIATESQAAARKAGVELRTALASAPVV